MARPKAKHILEAKKPMRAQPKGVMMKKKYDESDKLRKAREKEKKMIERLKKERMKK